MSQSALPADFRRDEGLPRPQLGGVERIVVHSRVVACDGGDGPLGHPRVWLRIVGAQHFCPYCSRLYVLDPAAGADDAH
ncbi:putative Zn-finger protein [Endobacter medicaginis]|uniref:Putative Zn-finger protein n=1 Tax=Endobacter medicaginis TaxID=1181271 RepID=A0A850NV28_9PROT|nr:zinc-finger domain-containing protein [Endobacter medicaginis]MBB3173580.1 putative Zn-finger protein [Endobacter medicaginis]MCX5475786.1 zinc-finger domain-containing protein [Endobacter medicaginis]NVN31616.1 zinc-finger domain-containing protein [Endobacter medicaginis]